MTDEEIAAVLRPLPEIRTRVRQVPNQVVSVDVHSITLVSSDSKTGQVRTIS